MRGCKAAKALDKLQKARETNQANIAAVAAFDPAPATTLDAELDRALVAPEPGHDSSPAANMPPAGATRQPGRACS